MGSLVPGWHNSKHEPDFREMGKPQEPEVPEWLQRVRSTDSDRDAKLHQAMESARKGLSRSSLTSSSLTSSLGTSPNGEHLSGRKSTLEAQLEDATPVDTEQRIHWWQRVDSSFGNDKPDAEKPENYKSGNYVPQHAVAKQHLHDLS